MHLILSHHPATPPSQPFNVWANVEHAASLGAVATTNIWFGVGAPAERFAIPQGGEPQRSDGLWKTTCFEAFLRLDGGQAYREWNFAPSGEWAAYDFFDYREGSANAAVTAPPYIRLEDNFTWWALGATIAPDADAEWQLGLSAVLEEKNGTKSYWALAHTGEKPDFHAPGCFTARLA
jgi:hypothetical protein